MKCPKCKKAKLRYDEDRRTRSARWLCKACGYSDWTILDGGRVK